jgi:hypothetical protein
MFIVYLEEVLGMSVISYIACDTTKVTTRGHTVIKPQRITNKAKIKTLKIKNFKCPFTGLCIQCAPQSFGLGFCSFIPSFEGVTGLQASLNYLH